MIINTSIDGQIEGRRATARIVRILHNRFAGVEAGTIGTLPAAVAVSEVGKLHTVDSDS